MMTMTMVMMSSGTKKYSQKAEKKLLFTIIMAIGQCNSIQTLSWENNMMMVVTINAMFTDSDTDQFLGRHDTWDSSLLAFAAPPEARGNIATPDIMLKCLHLI